MYKKIIIFFLCAFSTTLFAQNLQQDRNLANQYYNSGEYDKAAILYEKLLDKDGANVYKNYLQTLIELKKYPEAEELIKKQLKSQKQNLNLYIDLGNLYAKQENEEKAKEQYDKVIKNLNEQSQFLGIANGFKNANQLEYAVKTYEKARELQKTSNLYAYDMAIIYQKMGNTPKMIASFLDHIATIGANNNPSYNNLQMAQNALQQYISSENQSDVADELQKQLYARTQKEPNMIAYPELLAWSFLQQKNFDDALIQLKALDKQLNENGERIIDLAQQCAEIQNYDTAIEALNYVLQKGENNTNTYVKAKMNILEYRKKKITATDTYTQQDLTELEADYTDFLNKYGKNNNTTATIRDFGKLYANYFHNLDKAIELLTEAVENNAITAQYKSQCKLDLGDYYLMQNEIWEATLLYAQVDKAHKEDILGEEARFKNAQLSYFNGDFEWAQGQLDVLKASTSELIANDALRLSVFITDNLGLDTTPTPMRMFASSELLMLQNKLRESEKTLDSIETKYPKHSLTDDIWLQKAKLELRRKNYEGAALFLKDIIKKDTTDLLADDAIFMLGEINEKYLNNKAEAMKYYQTIILSYSNSLYAVEARKRYRKLRGDTI